MNTEIELNSSHSPLKTAKRSPQAANMFAHTSSKGFRLAGWEDTNIQALARAIGKSPQHIREILTGRRDSKLRLLTEVADKLNVTVGELVDRIRKAKKLDGERLTNELNLLRAKLKSRMLAAGKATRANRK